MPFPTCQPAPSPEPPRSLLQGDPGRLHLSRKASIPPDTRHVVSKPTTIKSSRKPHCQIQESEHQTRPCADMAALFMSISAILSLKTRHT